MNSQDRNRLLTLFSAMGASAALVPAFIPASAERFGSVDFSLLGAVPLLFGGLFLGVLAAPIVNLRVRLDLVIRSASLVLGLGLFGLFSAPDAPWFLLASAILGFGFGALEVSITAAFKKSGEDAARDLTKLNLLFAASSMTAPILLLAELSLFGTHYLLLVVALLSTGTVLRLKSMNQRQGRPELRGTSSLMPLFLAALFYVGAESILAGWSSTLVGELLPLSTEQAAIGSAVFWALIALGRWASLVVSPRLIATRLAPLVWSSVSATALFLAGVAEPAAALALFGVAIFAAGPIYALLVGRVLELVPSNNASATTAGVIVIGAAGGFTIPALLQLNPGITQAAWIAGFSFLLVTIFSLLGLRSKAEQPEEMLA